MSKEFLCAYLMPERSGEGVQLCIHRPHVADTILHVVVRNKGFLRNELVGTDAAGPVNASAISNLLFNSLHKNWIHDVNL